MALAIVMRKRGLVRFGVPCIAAGFAAWTVVEPTVPAAVGFLVLTFFSVGVWRNIVSVDGTKLCSRRVLRSECLRLDRLKDVDSWWAWLGLPFPNRWLWIEDLDGNRLIIEPLFWEPAARNRTLAVVAEWAFRKSDHPVTVGKKLEARLRHYLA